MDEILGLTEEEKIAYDIISKQYQNVEYHRIGLDFSSGDKRWEVKTFPISFSFKHLGEMKKYGCTIFVFDKKGNYTTIDIEPNLLFEEILKQISNRVGDGHIVMSGEFKDKIVKVKPSHIKIDNNEENCKKITDILGENKGGLHMIEIARRSKISKPTVGKLLFGLEMEGIVSYEKVGVAKQYFW